MGEGRDSVRTGTNEVIMELVLSNNVSLARAPLSSQIRWAYPSRLDLKNDLSLLLDGRMVNIYRGGEGREYTSLPPSYSGPSTPWFIHATRAITNREKIYFFFCSRFLHTLRGNRSEIKTTFLYFYSTLPYSI